MNHFSQINHSSDVGFETVFQYGSNFMNEKLCHQDGVAPQIGINGLPENNNFFIPMTKDYEHNRNFTSAHSSSNFDWIFTELYSKKTIYKRNP